MKLKSCFHKLWMDMGCRCFGSSAVGQKGKSSAHQGVGDAEEGLLGKTKQFTYQELSAATDQFHQRNKIGRGGFGTVYKGKLRNGTPVAVKALSAFSKQGLREFLSEIEAISNVRHPNLVQLYGCCVQGSNRILVYEYLEYNSLDSVLLGRIRTIKLDWAKRAAICLGTAKGLAYLHEELVPRIVHRDIKASNILLTRDFTPKIGDFGLAKLFPNDITHISTKIAGTTGYLAPEYALGGQLTMKADVYSFGVVLLEIVSGKSSSRSNWGGTEKLLLEWAWELYQGEKLMDLVDPELEDVSEQEVLRYIKVALFCTQENASRRPLMSQVVNMLSRDIRLNEKQITPPGFFQRSDADSTVQSKYKLSGASTSYQVSSASTILTEVKPR